VININMTVNL